MDVNRSGLKVLLVSTSYPVGLNKVSGIFVKRLADALRKEIDLTVLTPAPQVKVGCKGNNKIKCFRYAPMKWQLIAHQPGGIPVALKSNKWLFLLLPFFLLALFFNVLYYGRQVDVIHANWSVPGAIAGMAAVLIGKPVITTLRGSDVNSIAVSMLTRKLVEIAVRLNQVVVAVSDAIAGEIRSRWPTVAKKITVVPNGVEDDLFSIQKRHNVDHLTITTIGNLIPLKDVGTLIRAFSRLAGNIQLRVIGDGIEKRPLEVLSKKLDVEERVVFTGSLAPEDIAIELSNTDIFVLSSHAEGRPNVILEAMAAGRAIISTDLPGVKELIEMNHSGLLFEPGDTESLLEFLEKLISSETLRLKLGKNARKKLIEMELTWQACAASYIKIYRDLMERN